MQMTETEFLKLRMANQGISYKVMSSKGKNASTKAQKKKNKYWNKKVYVYERGITNEKTDDLGNIMEIYDSEKEYNRYYELSLLEKSGKIKSLERQVVLEIQEKFTYQGNFIQAINYKADFCYFDMQKNIFVVEDVKAFDAKSEKYLTTKDFNLKWKLLKYKYPNFDFRLF